MTSATQQRVSTRTLILAGLIAALLLAGVVSYYASAKPDGLNHVAQQQGFADTERPHGSADGPLAGYQAKGVEGSRLSGGIAGVAGVLVVLTLAGGLTWVLRRRTVEAS